MDTNIVKLKPECNLMTLTDGRGGIFTFYPDKPVVEITPIFTNAGEARGFHYHKEFEEYVLVLSGHGVYIEERGEGNSNPFVKIGPGDCVQFKIGVSHTLRPITDMSMVALLTKKWNDCDEPITQIEKDSIALHHDD
jgi:mannose-6-phosphate isomerase-like protein (cupin superfamily)